jgi:hypothetical protein
VDARDGWRVDRKLVEIDRFGRRFCPVAVICS